MGMTASDAQDGSFSVLSFVRVDLVVDDVQHPLVQEQSEFDRRLGELAEVGVIGD
jgi:hypothetical protein